MTLDLTLDLTLADTVQYYENLQNQLILKQRSDLKKMMQEQEKQQLFLQQQLIEMLVMSVLTTVTFLDHCLS